MLKEETESINENLAKVANFDEIPVGKLRHVEVDGKEILIVNVNGKYYAISDRCGHMNTLLSLGSKNGNTVTCPFHAAQFDVTTGQKVKEPSLVVPPMDKLPHDWKNFVDHIYKLNLKTKTYDQEAYKLVIDGDSINVSVQ